ncbi:MAG: hypothetical protein ACP6IP_08585 [Candidatus Njordarchaeia archaeon]
MKNEETKAKIVEEKIEEKETYVPEIVTLYFQRADNLKKMISIKTTMEDLMDRVVERAAKLLNIRGGRIGVTGAGEPIAFVGKKVGDILREYNTVSFQISSADMLG